ncbi:hypothetical protein H8959_013104 [Pygathrix nigripes]
MAFSEFCVCPREPPFLRPWPLHASSQGRRKTTFQERTATAKGAVRLAPEVAGLVLHPAFAAAVSASGPSSRRPSRLWDSTVVPRSERQFTGRQTLARPATCPRPIPTVARPWGLETGLIHYVCVLCVRVSCGTSHLASLGFIPSVKNKSWENSAKPFLHMTPYLETRWLQRYPVRHRHTGGYGA